MKNLEFEDVNTGIWTALLEKYEELDQISREKYGFGLEFCGFFDNSEGASEEKHTVFIPNGGKIDTNFGEIPPLRGGLVRSFSMEKLLFERRENGGK